MRTQWGSESPNTTSGAGRGERRSAARELLAQQLVELGGVGLALRRLHHLTDEEAEQLVLAGAVLLELTRILGNRLVDRTLDRGSIGDLPEATLIDDGVRVAPARPHG